MSKFEISKKFQEVFSRKTATLVKIGSAISVLIFGAGALCSRPANAAIIAGLNFDDSAFADILISSFGNYAIAGGDLATVLTDTTEVTYAHSRTPGAFVELGFTDNLVVNGLGNDLALFELGDVDTFVVTLNGTTRSYLSAYTGFSSAGFYINVASLNLDDFGIATGGFVDSIRIGLDTVRIRTQSNTTTVPSLSLVAALNSAPLIVDNFHIPEPSTMLGLFTVASFALASVRKKKQ